MGRMNLVDGDWLAQGLTAVADAIRELTKSEEAIAFPDGFSAAIRALAAGMQAGTELADRMVLGNLTSYSSEVAGAIRARAFDSIKSLVSVSLPNITEVGSSAFNGCSGLAEVYLPKATYFSGMAFNNCVSLGRLELPRVTTVGASVFSGCSGLELVDLGDGAASINLGAFNNCTVLTTLIIRAQKVCTASAAGLQNTPISLGNGYIYVPAAFAEGYKTANRWSDYAAQIRAIEDYPELCGGEG